MRKSSAFLLISAICLGGVSLAVAETGDPASMEQKVVKKVKARGADERMMPEPQVQLKRLSEGLQLTADQQKQIKPILEEEYASLKKIREDENLSPKQIQTQLEALRTATVAKVRTVLTPEQVEKYDTVSSEIKANKQRRMKENRKERLGTKADPPQHGSK